MMNAKKELFFLLLLLLFLFFSMGLWEKTLLIAVIANKIKWAYFLILVPVFFVLRNLTIKLSISITSMLIYCFIIVITISTLSSPYLNSIGLQYFIGYLVLFILSFFLPTSNSRPEVDEMLCKAIGYVALFVCLLSILLLFSSMGWGGSRFKGIYGNANGLGSIAVIAAIFSTTISRKKSKTSKILFIGLLFISAVCFFFTQSRAALAAISICLFVYFISEKSIKLFVASLVSIIILYAAISMINIGDGGHYQERELKMQFDDARVHIFNRHLELFLEKPFLGQGLSSNEFGGRFPAELAYTDILSFAGIIGGGALILAFLITCLRGYRQLKTATQYAKANYYIFLSILLMSIGDGYISNIGNPLPIFAWLYMGNLNRKST
jgi:O-antigen ligase